jgi:hypothetical protein
MNIWHILQQLAQPQPLLLLLLLFLLLEMHEAATAHWGMQLPSQPAHPASSTAAAAAVSIS